MTHLGIVMAATTAARSYNVICYHPGPWSAPQGEPGLTELASDRNLHTTKNEQALAKCDIVFVTLDVPLNQFNQPDFEPVRQLVNIIVPHLKHDAVLVIMSQVPPGFTRNINFPKERLFYQVETLIFGESVSRALIPERIIIGCAEPGNMPRVYHNFLREFGCNLLPMSYESAELSKIAINTMLIAQINTTNMLAEYCEHTGADWLEVVPALRSDPRIGQYAYLTPGLGLGGGHIERDLHTLLTLELYSGGEQLVKSFLGQSYRKRHWLLQKVQEIFRTSQTRIALLGLAYKPGTDSTINSPGIALLESLPHDNIVTHDPVVKHPSCLPSAYACYTHADILIIATPWPEYQKIKIMDLQQQMRGRVIIDPYRVLNKDEAVLLGFEYHTLGARVRYDQETT